MDNIVTYVKPNTDQKHDWESVPDDIKNTFERLGIPKAERSYLAGVGAQYDSEAGLPQHAGHGVQDGHRLLRHREALHDPQWEPLIHEKFMTLIPPTDHKFAALHGAVWSRRLVRVRAEGHQARLPAAELLPPQRARAPASLSTRSSSWRTAPTCTSSRVAPRPNTT